jgi:uncharacterized membrane protein (Fun14 family)
MTPADLLSPGSDSAVLVQVLVIIGVALPVGWLARRNRDLLLFVIGVAVFSLSLVAVRILH